MKNEKYFEFALHELFDYFARLGGSARYAGMRESDIILYVLCKKYESYSIIDSSYSLDRYIDQEFLNAAEYVLPSVNEKLDKAEISIGELIPFLLDFYNEYDKKLDSLSPLEKSAEWKEFGKLLQNYE